MQHDLKAAVPALMLALGAAALAPCTVSDAWADEASTDSLAAELRSQGFSCAKAEHAVRNVKLSVSNETVWEITCDNGVYRMTVVPDMAAKIERLKK